MTSSYYDTKFTAGWISKKVTLQFEVKQRKAALQPHVWHSCWKCLSAGAEKMRTEQRPKKLKSSCFYFSFPFSLFHKFTERNLPVLKCAKRVFYPSRVVSSCRGWCEAFSVWVVSRYKEVGVFLFLTQQTASRRPACRSHMLEIQRVTTWRNVTPSVFVWLIMQEQTRKYR